MPVIAFILLCLFWGSSFLFVKINIQYFPPVWAAGFRFLVATLALLPIVIVGKYKMPRSWREIYPALLFGVVNGIAYAMLFWATQFVPSSLSAILNGSMPFFTAIWAYVLISEKFSSSFLSV